MKNGTRRALFVSAFFIFHFSFSISAQPTIGDPIAIEIDLVPGERIELEPLEGVELVEQRPGGVIVRSFRPGSATLDFTVTSEDGVARRVAREIDVASVLQGDEEVEPAPLMPPVALPSNRSAWIAIGFAALATVLVWAQLLWFPRERTSASAHELSAAAEYLRVIERVRRMSPSDERFSTLSDATRRFLSRVDPLLGRELTSSELMERLRGRFPEWLANDVRDVLSEGDYAKFSPWGGRGSRFDAVVREANDLAVLDREASRS